jgi:hypothetical protein
VPNCGLTQVLAGSNPEPNLRKYSPPNVPKCPNGFIRREASTRPKAGGTSVRARQHQRTKCHPQNLPPSQRSSCSQGDRIPPMGLSEHAWMGWNQRAPLVPTQSQAQPNQPNPDQAQLGPEYQQRSHAQPPQQPAATPVCREHTRGLDCGGMRQDEEVAAAATMRTIGGGERPADDRWRQPQNLQQSTQPHPQPQPQSQQQQQQQQQQQPQQPQQRQQPQQPQQRQQLLQQRQSLVQSQTFSGDSVVSTASYSCDLNGGMDALVRSATVHPAQQNGATQLL